MTCHHLAAALAIVLFSCSAPPHEGPDLETVRGEIAARWADYIEAGFAKDADALVQIWAPDMRMLSDPGGVEDLRSAQEHHDLAVKAWQSISVTDLTVVPDEVTLVGDSAAIEIGNWTEGFLIDGTTDTTEYFGAYLGVWRQQPDGRWLLSRFIRNRHDFVNQTISEAVNRE